MAANLNMKSTNLSRRLAAAVMAVAAVGSGEFMAAGAGLPGGETGAARMEAARAEVVNVRSNIFITLVDLDQVRGHREPGNAQFQAFTNQLARMEQLARALGKRAEEMRQRGPAYFADWEASTATIQQAELRQKAQERYAERKRSYDNINRCMQDARKNFVPFVQELTTIKGVLERPLSPEQIAMAKDLFMRANWHCIDVQRALMEIEMELDELAASFRRD